MARQTKSAVATADDKEAVAMATPEQNKASGKKIKTSIPLYGDGGVIYPGIYDVGRDISEQVARVLLEKNLAENVGE